MGRKNNGIYRKAGIADDALHRAADVVDVIMRDKPIKMQDLGARRLAELEQCLKRERGLGHTAVVEDIMTIQSEYESVRLCNLGMRKANYAKHAVTEREIVGESAVHFILFLSIGRNSR